MRIRDLYGRPYVDQEGQTEKKRQHIENGKAAAAAAGEAI
jgi:hypothetical protein